MCVVTDAYDLPILVAPSPQFFGLHEITAGHGETV